MSKRNSKRDLIQGRKAVRIDKRTVIYVKADANEEQAKEAFLSRLNPQVQYEGPDMAAQRQRSDDTETIGFITKNDG